MFTLNGSKSFQAGHNNSKIGNNVWEVIVMGGFFSLRCIILFCCVLQFLF